MDTLMLGFQSAALAAIPGVSHRFFTAVGGTSPAQWRGLNTSYDVGDAPARVDENLARVRFQLGVRKRALLTAKQVHQATVLKVDDNTDEEVARSIEADALWTQTPELGVGIRTADCAPVLFATKNGEMVAAAHAGLRGAVGGVLEATLRTFEESGFAARDAVVAVGHGNGYDAFEVGPEVVDAAKTRTDVEGLARASTNDRFVFDLAGYCERLLNNAGVASVDVIRGCTVSDPATYFSYRASGGRCGRMMSAIAKTTPPPAQ